MKAALLVALVLTAAVALQFQGGFSVQKDYPLPALREALAVEPDGWIAEDLPIGDTELLKQTSQETLRYDDYIFRRYRRGNVELTVYVAYWHPGKHPPQMIAQHTPDMCWTLNGMTCEEMRFHVRTRIDQRELWPAQWRKFRSPSGEVIYTMFWHLVGQRPFDYGSELYNVPDPVTYWVEAINFALTKRRPQLFFRVTSSEPPESLWHDAGVQKALRGFIRLGLARPEN
jgi:hypothetical protein